MLLSYITLVSYSILHGVVAQGNKEKKYFAISFSKHISETMKIISINILFHTQNAINLIEL